MKAIVQNEYGSPDVLELKEIDKPVVKDDDVLVRVHAAALNAGDYFCHERRAVRRAHGRRVAQTKELCSGMGCGRAR